MPVVAQLQGLSRLVTDVSQYARKLTLTLLVCGSLAGQTSQRVRCCCHLMNIFQAIGKIGMAARLAFTRILLATIRSSRGLGDDKRLFGCCDVSLAGMHTHQSLSIRTSPHTGTEASGVNRRTRPTHLDMSDAPFTPFFTMGALRLWPALLLDLE